MSEIQEKKELLCKSYNLKVTSKEEKSKFVYYRGFRISSLKLLLEYSFDGFVIKIEENHRERRFDIYMSNKNTLKNASKDIPQKIDLKEVEKFKKFYGSGFNIILFEEA